jgi:hypothetical protein
LHCCLNCTFYDPSAYNGCREPQAERVLDKVKGNFCDFFSFNESSERKGEAKVAVTKDKLEALFKK